MSERMFTAHCILYQSINVPFMQVWLVIKRSLSKEPCASTAIIILTFLHIHIVSVKNDNGIFFILGLISFADENLFVASLKSFLYNYLNLI